MTGYNNIIEGLIDHVSLLQELGERSVEMDSVLLKALETDNAAAQTAAPAVARRPAPRASSAGANGQPARRGAPVLEPASAIAGICARVAACEACPLHRGRTLTVPGRGNINSPDIMFIGEAPGAEEDVQGEPFVGRAGMFLTKMITAMGYSRDDIFIANICKCRPPNNRTPTMEEMQKCLPFLHEQIRVIRPKTLFLLGNTAIKGLLGGTAARGQWARFDGIPVISTYHPSYIIRFERGSDDSGMKRAKTEVWRACKQVLAQLGKPVPSPSRPAAKR